jgi:hypothetical protein
MNPEAVLNLEQRDNRLKATSHRATARDLLKAVKANANPPGKKEEPEKPGKQKRIRPP